MLLESKVGSALAGISLRWSTIVKRLEDFSQAGVWSSVTM